MFEALKTRIFPQILKASPQTIWIWVPACSTGQEAYSIAITLLELRETKNQNAPGIQIFATDVRDTVIEKGRRGYYPEGIENEVSPERLRRFFTRDGLRLPCKQKRSATCVSLPDKNVTADPPFSLANGSGKLSQPADLFDRPCCSARLYSTFHYALNSIGYLVLGNPENVGANSGFVRAAGSKA